MNRSSWLWAALGVATFIVVIRLGWPIAKVMQVTGLIADIIGALIMAWANFRTEEQINKLSRTYYGGNAYLSKDLQQTRALTFWGSGVLLFGFVLQLCATLKV